MNDEIHAVVSDRCDACCAGQRVTPEHQPGFLLPGSFNPLHQGHRAMASFVWNRYRHQVDFELSVVNVDKPTLSEAEVRSRLAQFDQRQERIWITRARTFANKAVLFPGCTFVVGADTAQRLFHLPYYSSENDMLHALDTVRAHSCRFIVFGRSCEGGFIDATKLCISDQYRGLFELIPESEFREDVSSTELRRKARTKDR